MAPRRYIPLGRCMYCLAAGVKLSEEHLIPKSLGGCVTLRDAVCEPCRIATGRLEQATLDRDFLVPKTLLALRRRRARGKGPGRLPRVSVFAVAGLDSDVDVDGGVDDLPPELELSASEFPRTFALPTFDPAGLLRVADPPTPSPRVHYVTCRLQVGTPTRDAIATTRPLADPHAYGYSLAKWAYGYAVAERGLACCDLRAIRQLLAGERDDVFNFVGTPHPLEPGARNSLHSLSLRENGEWLTVILNVLGSAGMPPYEVVIGSTKIAPARADEKPGEIAANRPAVP
jgi:hypothetical protein